MKALARRALSMPFALLPATARRRLIQAVAGASARRAPADALRELLAVDEDLAGTINELALAYDGGVHAKHRLMRYHDYFVSRIAPGSRVLDVGCGYGAVAYSIASRADATVVGIDLDAANVANARQRFVHPRLSFVHGTAPKDVPADPFDVVVASNVLEHVADRPAFLTGIQGRTRAARWLIRVPMINRDWRVPLRQELGLRHFGDPTHYIEYTRETFEQEMTAVGFAVAHLQVNWGEIWSEVAPCA